MKRGCVKLLLLQEEAPYDALQGGDKGDIWSLNEVKVHSNELTVFRFPLPYASLSFCRCPRPPVWTSR